MRKITELEAQLNSPNSYIGNFRTSNALAQSAAQQLHVEQNPRGFENVFEMEDENVDRSEYCGKCKYESRWCKHRKIRDDNKAVQAAVLTSSQTLGWREPIDKFQFGLNRSGMCKRTFHDEGHL